MQSDPENVFDCEDSPLNFGPSLQMDQPWYHEFARNFVSRHTRFRNWNTVLANTHLHFAYKPYHNELENRVADFTLTISSHDQRASNMVVNYLNNIPEITIAKPLFSQQASLDNNTQISYFHKVTAQYHSLMARSFEMFMKLRFKSAHVTFEIVQP